MKISIILAVVLLSMAFHGNAQKSLNKQLLEAATSGNKQKMKHLLKKTGIDVNTQNQHGFSALMLAAGICQTHCSQIQD